MRIASGQATEGFVNDITKVQIFGIIHTFLECALRSAIAYAALTSQDVSKDVIIAALKYETLSPDGFGHICQKLLQNILHDDDGPNNAFEDTDRSVLRTVQENTQRAREMLNGGQVEQYHTTVVDAIMHKLSQEWEEEDDDDGGDTDDGEDTDKDEAEEGRMNDDFDFTTFLTEWNQYQTQWADWQPSTDVERIGRKAIQMIECDVSF